MLLLPGLEAGYLRHRHRGFRAAPAGAGGTARPPLGPLPGAGPATRVRFVAWSRGDPQSPRLDAQADVVTVPLPLAFPLPPAHYMGGDQPWAVDGHFKGLDSFGLPMQAAAGRNYGIADDQEWADVVALLLASGR